MSRKTDSKIHVGIKGKHVEAQLLDNPPRPQQQVAKTIIYPEAEKAKAAAMAAEEQKLYKKSLKAAAIALREPKQTSELDKSAQLKNKLVQIEKDLDKINQEKQQPDAQDVLPIKETEFPATLQEPIDSIQKVDSLLEKYNQFFIKRMEDLECYPAPTDEQVLESDAPFLDQNQPFKSDFEQLEETIQEDKKDLNVLDRRRSTRRLSSLLVGFNPAPIKSTGLFLNPNEPDRYKEPNRKPKKAKKRQKRLSMAPGKMDWDNLLENLIDEATTDEDELNSGLLTPEAPLSNNSSNSLIDQQLPTASDNEAGISINVEDSEKKESLDFAEITFEFSTGEPMVPVLNVDSTDDLVLMKVDDNTIQFDDHAMSRGVSNRFSLSFEAVPEAPETPESLYKSPSFVNLSKLSRRPTASNSNLSDFSANSISRTNTFEDFGDEEFYDSFDEEDDPVNNIPPLTFSDLYRGKIPESSAPQVILDYTLPSSVQKILDAVTRSKNQVFPIHSPIPPAEALEFFEIVNSQRFRQYFFYENELEKYYLITEERFVCSVPEDHVEQIPEGIERGFAQVWFTKARQGIRQHKLDAAISDFNNFLKTNTDMNTSVFAYWERSQLLLMTGQIEACIKDLESLTEIRKSHLGSLIVKARLFQMCGMTRKALLNYAGVMKLKERHPESYLQQGILLEHENEIDEAFEHFKKTVNLDPLNLYALYKCAVQLFNNEEYASSLKLFHRLLAIDPLNGIFFAYRARCYAHSKRWEKAFKNINVAVKLLPKDFSVFHYRGCMLIEIDPNQAIRDLSVSILLEDGPDNCDSYYQRAMLYHKMGFYECAVDDYYSAIEYNPGLSLAYLNLGTIYMSFFQDFDRALEFFDKTIIYDPGHIKAYLYRGDLFKMIENAEKTRQEDEQIESIDTAITDYSKAIHLSPTNYQAYLHRGRLLLQKFKYREAKYDLLVAYNLNQGFQDRFLQKSQILAYNGKHEQIIHDFLQLKESPTYRQDPLTYVEVAKAYMNLEKYDSALGMFAKALTMMTKKRHTVLLQVGICYLKQEAYSKALQTFNHCLSVSRTFAEGYYYRGMTRLQTGSDKGLADLAKAIKYDKKHFDAWYLMALYHYQNSKFSECIECVTQALKINQKSTRAIMLKGASYFYLKKPSLAIEEFSSIIEMDRRCSQAFFNRAICYQLAGEPEKAIIDYSVILLMSEDSNAYKNRGLLYWKVQDTDNAISDLYAAKDYYPNDAYLHALLALCLQKMGAFEKSLEEFDQALQIDPFMREAYLGRGNVHVSVGDLENARRSYSKVIKLYPKCQEAYINIAFTYQMEGQSKRAWSLLNQILAIDSQSSLAYEARAIINYYMKNYFNALIDINRALEIDPKRAEFLNNRGLIHYAMGDLTDAFNSFDQAVRNDAGYQLAYFNKGNMYVNSNSWNEAIDAFTKAIMLNKYDKHSLLNRGITRVMVNDYEGAFADFNQSIQVDQRFAAAYANRGFLHRIVGKDELAEQDFSRALEIDPRDPYSLQHRAKTLVSQKKLQEAMKYLANCIINEQ